MALVVANYVFILVTPKANSKHKTNKFVFEEAPTDNKHESTRTGKYRSILLSARYR